MRIRLALARMPHLIRTKINCLIYYIYITRSFLKEKFGPRALLYEQGARMTPQDGTNLDGFLICSLWGMDFLLALGVINWVQLEEGAIFAKFYGGYRKKCFFKVISALFLF